MLRLIKHTPQTFLSYIAPLFKLNLQASAQNRSLKMSNVRHSYLLPLHSTKEIFVILPYASYVLLIVKSVLSLYSESSSALVIFSPSTLISYPEAELLFK